MERGLLDWRRRENLILDCVEVVVGGIVADKSGAPGNEMRRVMVPDMLIGRYKWTSTSDVSLVVKGTDTDKTISLDITGRKGERNLQFLKNTLLYIVIMKKNASIARKKNFKIER